MLLSAASTVSFLPMNVAYKHELNVSFAAVELELMHAVPSCPFGAAKYGKDSCTSIDCMATESRTNTALCIALRVKGDALQRHLEPQLVMPIATRPTYQSQLLLTVLVIPILQYRVEPYIHRRTQQTQ